MCKRYSEQQTGDRNTGGAAIVQPDAAMIERRRITVQGIVQGVGFRPFVFGEAYRCGLSGFVLNDSGGVTIEVEGDPQSLQAFQCALQDHAPPMASVDAVASYLVPVRGEQVFTIAHSKAGTGRRTLIAPDTSVCSECLCELWNPHDRRFNYPFINCTNCGPRFTIVEDVPYDRAMTTMKAFALCAACKAEYEDPLNRRFHAQPNACPACGPQIALRGSDGRVISLEGAIDEAAARLAVGEILAIKGLGGYHIACDATNAAAVAKLRQRKGRAAKPFALMVPHLETVRRLCHVNGQEAALLQSGQRPIVLLRSRPGNALASGVAHPDQTLGVMLPYTPLHHLLMHAVQTRGPGDLPVLVMTSGNRSDEPIAFRDDDAAARLGPIVDNFVTHDRAIHMRCDDSVLRVMAGGQQFVRRARGFAPQPIPLAFDCPLPLLACGGQLKNTFCLGQGRQAFISHHIGDLDNLETVLSFREAIGHYGRLFDITPEAVAYDLHPDYLATRYADELSLNATIGVQHHHAHIASVLAEHGIAGPVIGVAADGTGYGTDGAVWGGEQTEFPARRTCHRRPAPGRRPPSARAGE
ncbi:MAG: hypothetical protein NVSMB42_19060 [Herpetosiphon sp.]